ncbi:MAG: sigma-70 family RNA polymerase sigma factor [Actinomycetes bacterium]
MSRSPVEPVAESRSAIAALVPAVRALDQFAWETIFRQLYPRLMGYAGRGLGREAAQDAVSETMTRAVDRIGSFTWADDAFEAWIFGILRNVVHDAQRAHARSVGRHATQFERPDHEASAGLLAREETEELTAAFARLSPPEREILELRVVAGLSADEIAIALGKRPGAVRTAQSRALAKLRSFLEETP